MNWVALDKRVIIFIIYFNPDFIVCKLEAKDDEEQHTTTHVRHVQKEVTVIVMTNTII
jgi:outer membrane lipoprotein-sorting protein